MFAEGRFEVGSDGGGRGRGNGGVDRTVGSGNKKGDGLSAINNTNIFAALGHPYSCNCGFSVFSNF